MSDENKRVVEENIRQKRAELTAHDPKKPVEKTPPENSSV